MNHSGRIELLRNELQNQGIAGVFIPLDASFEYFTGAPRVAASNTCHRQNSAEYASLLITKKEVVYFNSRLSATGLSARIGQYPLITDLIPFPDADLCGETFVNACLKLGLKGQNLAYLQDISSTLVLRLHKDLNASWVNFDPVVQRMRAKKDPEEQLLMAKAAAINDTIYSMIFSRLQPGTAIEEIVREIDRLAIALGAETNSFATSLMNFGALIGEGYGDYYPVLQRGYVLAFDYGVLYKGYCSDYGRTVFIGEPEADLVKAHELIMKAQNEAMTAMKAGQVKGAEMNRLARQVINDGGYDKEFSHRLGHGIGKDVHERPFLAEGEDTLLETGMFFTVEPSLCLPHRALIRVEDVVMVTPEGGKNQNSSTHELVVIE
jgi:Xaa-Pro aminopeptidase